MDPLAFALSWSPVAVLTVLAVGLRRPAMDLAIWGGLFTLALVLFYYDTPFTVTLWAGLDGVLTTLPLMLVIFAGILLSTLLSSAGALSRIVEWFRGGVRDGFQQKLLIALGVGNFMEGAGVIAEPVVAPMMRAAGVGPAGSAALSIVGYAGLMTLELAGIIITVLAIVTGLPLAELGLASAWLSIPATVIMALAVPFFLPRPLPGLGSWLVVAACGAVLGFTALAAVAWISVSASGMVAGLAVILGLVLVGTRRLEMNRQVLVDLAPFLFLLVVLMLVNAIGPLRELTFSRLAVTAKVVPVHGITFRPFFSAYLYLLIAFVLAARLHKVGGEELRRVLREGAARGWRASLAVALFGAMGQIIAYSGYTSGFAELVQANNLPWVMAHGIKSYTGGAYPVFVPFLGWVGTFLTGYGVASIMLFGQLQVETAGLMGISAAWLSAGLAVGCSLGSISSPYKIAIAAPMCGAQGMEGDILRWTIPLGVGASFIIGVVLWLVA